MPDADADTRLPVIMKGPQALHIPPAADIAGGA
jgi:hypothetical protein